MKKLHLGVMLLALSTLNSWAGTQQAGQDSCGYSASTGAYAAWYGGYSAWASLKNESGETATSFELFLDIDSWGFLSGYQAEFIPVDGGYLARSPGWFKWLTLPPGFTYGMGFLGTGPYRDIAPYVLAINGQRCDTVAPDVALDASQTVFTRADTLSLTANASDNVALKKVVFERNGVPIGQDYDAPYTLDIPVSDAWNGKSTFTARAIDISGNESTATGAPVYAAIGKRFFGSAPSGTDDFDSMTTLFNQLTPENAGKWGSVEAERDVMDWTQMDIAYAYSRDNNIPIKLHTLVWGQQAPAWIDDLPAAEQLAEVEEWYAALAARYPDAEMVDVVNEPLHAPASFREALGGDGDTGWDWVITAFTMARAYFPDAQLILNDYNILILENFTSDYLAIVTVLQERGLIDGIGLQAHFLERADLAVVEANVATLAATGLPIYISELDVNFADDARHAQRLSALFKIFWENPSVVGVTHWGHLEGDIWREQAYLVRSDGSLRPAMDWLTCYRAGGTECVLPPYTPAGWTGTANGLTLQAELYDEGVGIAALGDNVTYADGGDWFAFYGVNFEAGWENFWLTYAKGSDTETRFSVHLDSLDSPAILTLPLVNTGGWGTAQTLQAALPAITGAHDVYFQFTGSTAAGNIDVVRFGLPEAPPVELMPNGGFESGNTDGWYSWNGGVVSAADALVFEGSYALQVAEREGNAPAAYNISSLVAAGGTYELSMMAAITGEASADVNVTLNVVCGEDSSYNWIVNPTALVEGQWQMLTAKFTLPECELSSVQFFAEGPGAGINLYLDNVSLLGAPGEDAGMGVLANPDFEGGSTAGWFSWSGTLGVSSDFVYEGDYALHLSERTDTGSPAATSLLSLLSPGQSYTVTAAVAVRGATDQAVQLVLKVACEGEDDQYSWVANTSGLVDGEWVLLNGQIDVPECSLTDLLVYAQGPAAEADLYLDNVVISQ